MKEQTDALETSVQEQIIQFSRKHLPQYMIRYLKYPLVQKILNKLLCFREIIELDDQLRDYKSIGLVNALAEHTGLSCTCENLNKVPSSGRLLIVANHPLGGADWLLIVKCLSTIRRDIKVVINKDVNTLIVNMRDLFIPVDTYAKFNDPARKKIGESLEREEAVLLFPAGGISVLTAKGVRDKKWKNGVVHFSRDHHTDILPVYIGDRLKLSFYLCPGRLRRFFVVRQLIHPEPHNVNIIFGDIVPHREIAQETDLSIISGKLRSLTYQLGEKRKFING